jgi:hypothetical protein
MKGWLIICAIGASAVAHAASTTANAQPQQRIAVESKPVSTRTLPVSQTQSPAAQPAGQRHLSEEERAELRRQLEQFNRQYSAKGS